MRIAEQPPVYCTGCHAQYPDRQHVDFEASYDGPLIQGGVMGDNGVVNDRLAVSIDELVLCEDCVAAAARMLGMDYKHSEKLKKMRAEVKLAEEKARGLQAYIDQLEKAVAARPARQKVPVA